MPFLLGLCFRGLLIRAASVLHAMPILVTAQDIMDTWISLSRFLMLVTLLQYWKYSSAFARYWKDKLFAFPELVWNFLKHYFSCVEVSLQSCSRILLEEKLYKDFLRKMRNPKLEALRKCDLVKKIIKKCSTLTTGNKSTKCSRCGYLNGLDFFILLYTLAVPIYMLFIIYSPLLLRLLSSLDACYYLLPKLYNTREFISTLLANVHAWLRKRQFTLFLCALAWPLLFSFL